MAMLTLVAAVAAVLAMDFARRSDSDPARSPAASSAPAAKPKPLAEVTPHESHERNSQRVLEIERALVSNDARQRETAFNVTLPELLESEPRSVIELVARQQGETRDVLRDEVVRLWITRDRDAARMWMGSFENEGERKASATIAMRTLAAIEPAQAIAVANEFGIGRDDGSLEHIVQIWATEDFDACTKWLEMQPDNAHIAPLRARIEQVREQRLTTLQ